MDDLDYIYDLTDEVERLRSLFARVECTKQYENPWNKHCSSAFPGERDSWCPNCITVGEINGTDQGKVEGEK